MTKKNLQGYQREAAEKYAKKFGGYGYNTGKVISTSCVYSFFAITLGVVGASVGALAGAGVGSLGAGVGAIPLSILGGAFGGSVGVAIGLSWAHQSEGPQKTIESCANSGKSLGETFGSGLGFGIVGPVKYITDRVANIIPGKSVVPKAIEVLNEQLKILRTH